ncbi:hypothetical protein ACH4ND_17615 [Streptomyces sp. NPDC017179]|uniref:hypothetical protein n=1 Tax=Streptomyces sp. NPDC017179 TaxID=3364979 RepID=UPI0037AC8801
MSRKSKPSSEVAAAHRVCEMDGFDTLIRDQPCPADLRTALTRAGATVVVG